MYNTNATALTPTLYLNAVSLSHRCIVVRAKISFCLKCQKLYGSVANALGYKANDYIYLYIVHICKIE